MALVPAVATYRLQLTPDFGFAKARQVVPHLARFGVSHVYLSPIFEARIGSTHGYDQTDPTRVRGELGGEDGFRALAQDVRARRMGIILDIVPNHLAADYENRWWRQTLAQGEESKGARFFDVDWRAGKGRAVLPLLDKPLTEAGRRDYRGTQRWHAGRALRGTDFSSARRWPTAHCRRGNAGTSAATTL